MNEYSPWHDAFGPVFSAEALTRNGVAVIDDLITIHTTEVTVVYPHGQFTGNPDGLHRNEVLISIWNEMIAPAMVDGTGSEYTLVAWYLGHQRKTDGGYNKLARADEFLLADNPKDEAARVISKMLGRWRH
jgi:hypothetical protein